MVRFENVIFPYQGNESIGNLFCDNGKIVQVEKTIRATDPNRIVIPGFVDTHTHGFRGYTSESAHLSEYLKSYLERGVTTVCPTVGPRPLKEYGKLIERYKMCTEGAFVAGLHLEGPYLSPIRHGAIDVKNMYDIDVGELQKFITEYGSSIAIMTIAPEVAFAQQAVKMLNDSGIKISYGHTDALYNDAAACYIPGKCGATHLLNAMRPINHHEAGVLDFALCNKLPSEIICDGNHINTNTMSWVIDCLGKDKVHCISDGGETCGLSYPDGTTLAEGVIVQNGAVYEQDVLSGSTKDIYDGFLSFIKDFHYSLCDACAMTSTNAADFLGVRRGKIAEGCAADLLVLDLDLCIQEIYHNGIRVK